MKLAVGKNRPPGSRAGRRPPLVPTDALTEGYEIAADALAGSPPPDLDALQSRPRVLFRSTSAYAAKIRALIDPENLGDEQRFKAVLDSDRDWAGAFDELGSPEPDGRRWQEALVADERAALLDLDVPAFTFDAHTGGVTLDGREYVGVFEGAPAADLRRRWHMLGSPADRVLQIAMIRIAVQGHRAGTQPERDRATRSDPVEPERVRRTIGDMVDRIIESAVDSDGAVRWLVARMDANSAVLHPWLTDGGLYRGSAGIGLLLGLVAERLDHGNGQLVDTARRSLWTGLDLLPENSPTLRGAQLESGRSGWAYAAAHVGAGLGDEKLLHRAADLALPETIDIGPFEDLDLISGWAGVIAAATAVADIAVDDELEHRAEAAADVLAAEVRRRQHAEDTAPHLRLSMAHGVFGIELALERASRPGSLSEAVAEDLAAATQDRIDAREGVPGRIHRERRERRPDTSWCWGTAGYLAAHANVEPSGGRPVPEVETATQLCATEGGPIDRLCCGTAGRLAALVAAGRGDLTGPLVAGLVGRWDDGELVGDTATEFVGPSLFRGLAGVAYALLSTQTDVPNILGLAARTEPTATT